MPEQCFYCGKFTKRIWHLASDEPNDWQDYQSCKDDDEHRTAHPWAYDDDVAPQNSDKGATS